MHSEHVEHKDEEAITDYQFKHIMDLKDENTALRKENETLKKELEALRTEKTIYESSAAHSCCICGRTQSSVGRRKFKSSFPLYVIYEEVWVCFFIISR